MFNKIHLQSLKINRNIKPLQKFAGEGKIINFSYENRSGKFC